MEGFLLDDNGDAVIEDGRLQITGGSDLIAQTVRQVLLTNIGEWWLNEDEGIDFSCLLTKNPNVDQIQDNVKAGLKQVDDTFEITYFNCSTTDRKLTVNFKAVNSSGEEIEVTV